MFAGIAEVPIINNPEVIKNVQPVQLMTNIEVLNPKPCIQP